MKKGSLILLLLAVATMSACKLESDNCPAVSLVPFVKVEMPDSVAAGYSITIDAKLYDYGCYTDFQIFGLAKDDSVLLEAEAEYDNCDCPKTPYSLDLTFICDFDSSQINHTIKFFYTEVFANGDSVRSTCDSIFVY